MSDSVSLPPSTALGTLRLDSAQRAFLHVYSVPLEIWNEQCESALADDIVKTISEGFARVPPDLSLEDLREELFEQLKIPPSGYVFVKSVGRCLTRVKTQQERELRVKHFRPIQGGDPEIFLLRALDTGYDEAEAQREAEARMRERKGVQSGGSTTLVQDKKDSLDNRSRTIPDIKSKASGSRLPAKNIVKPLKPLSPLKQPQPAIDPKVGGKAKGKSGPAQSMTMNELKTLQNRGNPSKRPRAGAPTRAKVGPGLPNVGQTGKRTAPGSSIVKQRVAPLAQARAGRGRGGVKMGARVNGKDPVRPSVKTGVGRPLGEPSGERNMEWKDTDVKVLYKLRQKPGPSVRTPRDYNYSPPKSNGTIQSDNSSLAFNTHHQYPSSDSHHLNPNYSTILNGNPRSLLTHQSNRHTPGPQSSCTPSIPLPGTNPNHSTPSQSQSLPLSRISQNGTSPTHTASQQRSLPATSSNSLGSQLGMRRSISVRKSSMAQGLPNSSQYPHSQVSSATLPTVPPDSHASSRFAGTSLGSFRSVTHDRGGNSTDGVPLHGDTGSHLRVPSQGSDDSREPSSIYSRELVSHRGCSRDTGSSAPESSSNFITNRFSSSSDIDDHTNYPSPSSHALPVHPASKVDSHPQLPGQDSTRRQIGPQKGGPYHEVSAEETNGHSGFGEQRLDEVADGQQRLRHDDYRQPPDPGNRLQGPPSTEVQFEGQRHYYQQGAPQSYPQQQQQGYPVMTQGPSNYRMDLQQSHHGAMGQRGGGQEMSRGPPPLTQDYSAINQNTGYQGNSYNPSRGPHSQQVGPHSQQTGPYQEGEGTMDHQRRDGVDPRYLGQGGQGYGPPRQPDQDRGLSGWSDQDRGPPTWQSEDNTASIGPSDQSRYNGSTGGHQQYEAQRAAIEDLQLDKDDRPPPEHHPKAKEIGSPKQAPSDFSSRNPETQQLREEIMLEKRKRLEMEKVREEIMLEKQERLEMEKAREELIKKAKALKGKTIDRRKKAREYWKKRYYDEKKKTPALEDRVSRLAGHVQQQNRKLMSHLEGKGAKAPKGPPSKKMDHKIQIFRHQHGIEELKRNVDNAKMKLATEIKLRTQAETELRILKSEVTQKKINLTLKKGKRGQETGTKAHPTPRTGNSI